MNDSIKETLNSAVTGDRLTGTYENEESFDGSFQSFDKATGTLILNITGEDSVKNYNIENISKLSKLVLKAKALGINQNTTSLKIAK